MTQIRKTGGGAPDAAGPVEGTTAAPAGAGDAGDGASAGAAAAEAIDRAPSNRMAMAAFMARLEEAAARNLGPAGAGELERDLPDPALMDRDAASAARGVVSFERAQGALLVEGPGPADPTQGWLGNCYFIAAMSAVASASPGTVAGLMKDNGDGTVTVRLSELDKDGKATTQDVTVDLDLVVRRGEGGAKAPYYASSPDRDAAGRPELWPAVLEKAFAQRAGGYQKIGMGGSSALALEALTGKRAEFQGVGERVGPGDLASAEAIARLFKIENTIPLESVAKARREGSDKAWSWLREGLARGAVVADTYAKADVVDRGFLPMHAYAVLGAEERDGKRFVTLRNPAPYIAELETNPVIADEIRQDPAFAELVDAITGKRRPLRELSYGTFTVPWEDFRRCVDTAFRVPVGGGGTGGGARG